MSSTYSTNLALELIGTGDQAGTWGNTTNTNLGTLIEQAISGYVTQAVSTGTDTTITIPNGATGVARNMYIELTGTGGASTNLIVPANKKLYFIFNNTSSGQVTVKVSGQTGVSVPNKAKIILVSNGTDVVDATNYIGNISAASANITVLTSASATITNLIATSASITTLTNNPTFSGGTANGVTYLNGSKVLTSGSALTYNGTALTSSASSAISGIFNRDTSSGATLQIQVVGNSVGTLGSDTGGNGRFDLAAVTSMQLRATGASSFISFDANNAEAMRLTSTSLYTASGINVGIGTSSPAYKLDVNTGQIRANESTTGSGDGGLIAGTVGANGNAGVLFQTNGASRWNLTTLGTNGASLRIYNYALASTVATFDSSGNLGIGTSSPSTYTIAPNLVVASSGFSGMTIRSASNNYGGVFFADGTTGDEQYRGFIQYNHTYAGVSDYMFFGTAGAIRMTLTDSGSLGIGTSSPSYKLDVQGNGSFTSGASVTNVFVGSAVGNGGATVRFLGSNTQKNWMIGNQFNVSGALEFTPSTTTGGATFTTPAMLIDSFGNLGIGTTSPTQRLHIVSSGQPTILIADDAGRQVSIKSPDSSGNPGFVGTTTNHNLLLQAGTSGAGANVMLFNTAGSERARFDGDGTFRVKGAGTAGSTDAFLVDGAAPASAARITSGGEFLVGTTSAVQFNTTTVTGWNVNNVGQSAQAASSGTVAFFNRLTDDGTIVSLRQAGTEEGTISVSGNTVSYNAFAGSHWSQLQDGSKPDILRGTVMESINELCVWPDENNERLPKAKISDTAGSKKVYGVFMAWDNDWTTTNDMYVTAVGAFICRVNGSVTVQEGDLLESNGDGTARVQADDIIRSSTIGKVTSTVKTHQYADGSYCVPTVLYCG